MESVVMEQHFFEQLETLPAVILKKEKANGLPSVVPTHERVKTYLEHDQCAFFSVLPPLVEGKQSVLNLSDTEKETLYSQWPICPASAEDELPKPEVGDPSGSNLEHFEDMCLKEGTTGSVDPPDENKIGTLHYGQASSTNQSQLARPSTELTNTPVSAVTDQQEAQTDYGEEATNPNVQPRQPSVFEQIVKVYTFCAKEILSPSDTSVQQKLSVDSRLNRLFRCFEMLHIFNEVNERHNQLISYQHFYIPGLENYANLQHDYYKYTKSQQLATNKGQNSRYFCQYPFLMDFKAKAFLMCSHTATNMEDAVFKYNSEAFSKFKEQWKDSGIKDETFREEACKLIEDLRRVNFIVTDREKVFEQAVGCLPEHCDWATPLLLPVVVSFVKENAGGEGGVRQEFFNELFHQVLDPKFGMFQTEEDDSLNKDRLLWVKPSSQPQQFFYFGQLCGLAIHNDALIELPFPLAFFKKLLGKPVDLEDFKEVRPTCARSLESLLSFTPKEVEDLVYTFVYVDRGVQYPLKPGGDQIDVTIHNRREYVELCVDYALNVQVKDKFEMFKKGLMTIVGGKIWDFFRPEELQEMLTGAEEFDFEALKMNTWYEGEYRHDHPTIQFFWEVIDEMDDAEKRQFMRFLSSLEKCSVTAMRTLKLTIIPTRPDEEGGLGMPFSHTCFEVLRLPLYTDKEMLRERLLFVIGQTGSFGSTVNNIYG